MRSPALPLTALLLTLALTACGGARPDALRQAPPAAPTHDVMAQTAPADALPPGAAAEAEPVGAPAAPAPDLMRQTTAALPALPGEDAGAAPDAGPTQAELDFAAIYGQDEAYNPIADPTLPPSAQMPVSYDPWEGFNRRMHRFNNALDRTVARPLATAYVRVVPRPVRLGVSNFFSNLGQPVSALNALLQGKPRQAGQSLSRFVINTTLGIGGIFDPASDADIPNRSEDFGQTLGVWGWENSRYLELPLFGPRTVRDVFGLAGDAPLSPTRQIGDDGVRFGLQGLQLVDIRTQLMSVDRLREGAADEYALVRDAWLQRRNYQIHGDRQRNGVDDLPDYLLEDDANPTVPADAMPITLPEIRIP